jgi:hypothetical protein
LLRERKGNTVAEPHVVTALVRKRAEVAGEIEAAEKRVARFRAELVHLDAVLRLFDAAAEPLAIPPKRPWRRTGWFRNGELPRRVLETLRAAAPEPLCAGGITARIMADKGLEAGDGRAVELIRKSVNAYLRERTKDGLVRRVAVPGSKRDARWRLDVPAETE